MASKILYIGPAKFLTTFFYRLSNFRTIRSLDAPSRAASCPGNDIFLFIFCHQLHFFLNWPLGCPPRWMPRAVAPPPPLPPPDFHSQKPLVHEYTIYYSSSMLAAPTLL